MGLTGGDPAISFECPTCELVQRPFTEIDRTCAYCGVKLHRNGATVFWWRDHVDVQPWEPRR